MNMVMVYLIVTMGSQIGISYQGFGGVSVTPVPSYEICEQLKDDTYQQLKATNKIDIDDVIITCKKY